MNVNGEGLLSPPIAEFTILVVPTTYADTILVEFRLIVFRPFKGEIILGRISSASDYGMKSMSWTLMWHRKG